MSDADLERAMREDVAEVLVRYATGIDQRDWTLFRTCFTDDCVADYGEIGRWRGVDQITDWMDTTHAPFGHTMHRITNVSVQPTPDGATARSYVHVVLRDTANAHGVQAYGFYDDALVRTDSGWKIAQRRYTMVHQHVD